MAGGSGILRWIAPNQGNFDDLALWGDSPTTHLWAGQAELTLEGAFFTPFATVEYAGTSGQNQVRAQFIANRLHARGNGSLTVAPALGRAIDFKRSQSALIRKSPTTHPTRTPTQHQPKRRHRSDTTTPAPIGTYVALLLYLWVRFGLGVGVGGCRERVMHGR